MNKTFTTLFKYIYKDKFGNYIFRVDNGSELEEYLTSTEDDEDLLKPFYYNIERDQKNIKLKGIQKWKNIDFVLNGLYEMKTSIRHYKYDNKKGFVIDIITCKNVNLSLDISSDSP